MNKSKERAFISRLNSILMWVLIVCVFLLATPIELVSTDLATKLNSFNFVLWIMLIIAASNFISQGLVMVASLAYNALEGKIGRASCRERV